MPVYAKLPDDVADMEMDVIVAGGNKRLQAIPVLRI